jgi:hypothetical protein
LGAIPDGAMRVQVKDEDGSYRDCEYDGGEPVEPLALHTLSLLIDGSGSMELSYPPSEYGDVCVTCPHDVNRDRVGASAALVRAIHTDSPESIIAIAEFGPDAPIDPDYDFRATTLHHDFATDTESVVSALDRVRGYEEHGTPLYDSVGEMISATMLTADTAGETQRSIILLSDGLDNESEQFELHDVIAFARQANVAIYTVGLGPASVRGIESDTELKNIDAILALQELARETGGFYASADDPESLQALYDTIAVTFTDGYRRESYDCRPDPEPEPHDPCGCPSSGDPIHGRLLIGNQTLPWSSIAP